MKLTRNAVNDLRGKVNNALVDLSKEHGIQFSVGSIHFDTNGNWAKFNLEVARVDGLGEDEVVHTREYESLVRMASIYNIDLDRTYKYVSGGKLRVGKFIGYNSRAHKYPFLFETDRGQVFKMGEKMLANVLQQSENIR